MQIPVHAESEEFLPERMTKFSAGADLHASEDATLYPGERTLVATGLSNMKLPEDCVALIHPRSGLAYRYGITVLNTPGTIDADYRGPIKVLLYNAGAEPYHVVRGERIAQLLIQPVIRVDFIHDEEEDETERGAGGFGSTGQ